MQTTVWTQEMINDRFLPLQSLQRASRIELIQKNEFFSLYIQGWTTQIPLTSTNHCSISQQHISQVLIIFFPTCRPKHSDQHELSVCWSCLNRSRGTISERDFFSEAFRFTDCKTSESISDKCCELSNMTSCLLCSMNTADQLWVVCLYFV